MTRRYAVEPRMGWLAVAGLAVRAVYAGLAPVAALSLFHAASEAHGSRAAGWVRLEVDLLAVLVAASALAAAGGLAGRLWDLTRPLGRAEGTIREDAGDEVPR